MTDEPNTFRKYFEPEIWWRMPLKLRVRWWSETDYSRWDPGSELFGIVMDINITA